MPATAHSGWSWKSSTGFARWCWRPATICAPRRMGLHCWMSRPRWRSLRSTITMCGPRSMARWALRSRADGTRWSNTGAQTRRPAVHCQRLRPVAGTGPAFRADMADHRPEHGGQIDLPSAERADRADGANRQLRTGGARPDRHRRPAVLSGGRRRRSGARALHLHGRDGRDRRDPHTRPANARW